MPRDVIEEQLSVSEEEKTLEKKPTEREEEFARVMDIVTVARDDFLAGAMPLEAVIAKIQADLVRLLPKPGPTGASTMDAIANMRAPGMGALGR